MFSFLGKESCPIQLYGKLPLAKDYLRLGAGAGAGLALRDWLDRAFSQGGNAKDPLKLPWPAVLLIGESWGGTLCGAAWPSGDAGNLRPFPFVAFVERKKKALLEDLEAGLPLSAAVLERLRECHAAREQHADGQAYLAAMRGREIALEELEPAEPEPVSFERWLRALWPADGKDGLLATLRALDALRRSAYRGPIRLPLAVNLPPRPQAQAWVRLLLELNLVARDTLPTLIFPLPEAPNAPATEEPAAGDEASGDALFGSSDFASGSPFDAPPEPSVFDAPAESGAFDTPPDEPAPSGDEPPSEEAPAPEAPPPDPADGLDPHFLVVFRTTPSPADAVWLRPPAPKAPRRDGDLCDARARLADLTDPDPESLPPLADSLRGAFASLRGQIAR